MMQFLVKIGIYDPVAMYFRNDYMRKYEECSDNVLTFTIEETAMKESIAI